jgi:hypothetical protein
MYTTNHGSQHLYIASTDRMSVFCVRFKAQQQYFPQMTTEFSSKRSPTVICRSIYNLHKRLPSGRSAGSPHFQYCCRNSPLCSIPSVPTSSKCSCLALQFLPCITQCYNRLSNIISLCKLYICHTRSPATVHKKHSTRNFPYVVTTT